MRRHRSDSNQQKIVEALQDCGAFVVNLNQVGNGCPDLAVTLGGDVWYLVEVKTDSPLGWKYEPSQKTFRKRCPATIPVLTTVDEAVAWVNSVRRERLKEAV